MANQYEADPRQAEFLKNYLDPKSKTFSNAYQSALKAGYEEKYAQVILSKDLDWLSENVKTEKLLNKALKNLEELLDEKDDKRIKADITKFVVSRQGKDKGWSDRTELTGKDGDNLMPEQILVKFIDDNDQATDNNQNTNGIQETV